MLIIIILFGRRHEHSNVIFGPGHTTSAIKSTSHKFSQEGNGFTLDWTRLD